MLLNYHNGLNVLFKISIENILAIYEKNIVI